MMRWDFHAIKDYVAVSVEEYTLPLFGEKAKEIEIYLNGNKMTGVVSVTTNVSSFVYVTVRPDKRMHYYIECDGFLYELFGTTTRKALNALTESIRSRFDALKVGDNLAYSWGKEWYLVAPFEWKEGRCSQDE